MPAALLIALTLASFAFPVRRYRECTADSEKAPHSEKRALEEARTPALASGKLDHRQALSQEKHYQMQFLVTNYEAWSSPFCRRSCSCLHKWPGIIVLSVNSA